MRFLVLRTLLHAVLEVVSLFYDGRTEDPQPCECGNSKTKERLLRDWSNTMPGQALNNISHELLSGQLPQISHLTWHIHVNPRILLECPGDS